MKKKISSNSSQSHSNMVVQSTLFNPGLEFTHAASASTFLNCCSWFLTTNFMILLSNIISIRDAWDIGSLKTWIFWREPTGYKGPNFILVNYEKDKFIVKKKSHLRDTVTTQAALLENGMGRE